MSGSPLAIPSLALVARLLFFLLVRPWDPAVEDEIILAADGRQFHNLARTLLSSGRFAFSPDGAPEALRTPGYPAFLAGAYALAGERPWVALLLQIGIDTCSCALLLSALTRLFDRRIGRTAAVLYALDPFLIPLGSSLLSDVPFVFLLVTALRLGAAAAEPSRSPERARWAWIGVAAALGAATWVRPIALFLPAPLAAFVFLRCRRARGAAATTAAFLVAFAAVVSPWFVRNARAFGAFGFSTSGAYNLLVLDVAAAEAGDRGQPQEAIRDDLLAEADAEMERDGLTRDDLNPFQRAAYWREVALRHIRGDPAGFAKAWIRGMVDTFANLGTTHTARMLRLAVPAVDIKARSGGALVRDFLRRKGPAGLAIGAAVGIYLLITYLASAVGLIVAWRRHDRWALAFCLVVALYFVGITGAAGLSRFKVPAVPFYLGFAAVGLRHLLVRSRRNRAGG
jgi:4-amino-4-deoxy-L-arabinose transferase-like glycosyltransferase